MQKGEGTTRGRRLPSPAWVLAAAALIAALAGTAVAVDKITSKDIAKNAVRSKHIKKNQVKVKDTDLVKRRRIASTFTLAPLAGHQDPVLNVTAKQGDLILVHAAVEGRRDSGAGDCSVGMIETGPEATAGFSQVMAFTGGAFVRKFIDDLPSAGGEVHLGAQGAVLPVVDSGAYGFGLGYSAPPGTTCSFRNRNLYTSVLR